VAAAVARHELEGEDYPLYIALGRALAATRMYHQVAGGNNEKKPVVDAPPMRWGAYRTLDENDEKKPDIDAPNGEITRILCWRPPTEEQQPKEPKPAKEKKQPKEEDPAFEFRTAYPPELMTAQDTPEATECKSNLLGDLIGPTLDYYVAKATEVVFRGTDEALRAAPKARYGNFITVDREEIQCLNSIRNLIVSYCHNPRDTNPLSIAVFGPPGSGKSTAIKQLAETVLGPKPTIKTFNLSQMQSVKDLHEAFHQVRDASLKGYQKSDDGRLDIPLVFWDEFDAKREGAELGWLQEFLAPMQDANFVSGGIAHPFGKAIFIFAGGTKRTFEVFSRKNCDQSTDDYGKFKNLKGPDFVSRLRGYLDIKGPNPKMLAECELGEQTQPAPLSPGQPAKNDCEHLVRRTILFLEGELSDKAPPALPSHELLVKKDPEHLIRRAILLRSFLENLSPHLINPQTKLASIGANIVCGFLRAKEFLHGARSLEAIVKMSSLEDARQFGAAELPTRDLLRMHVSDDFLDQVRKSAIEPDVVEVLAAACHQAWLSKQTKLDPANERHKNYDKLGEKLKEDSRKTARLTQAKLAQVGYEIVRQGTTSGPPVDRFPDEERTKLMGYEHDIWMRDHLIDGWEWTSDPDREKKKRPLRLHRDVCPFEAVPVEDQEFDEAIVDSVLPALSKKDFMLVPIDAGAKPPPK
jgi:hypothetical protein